MNGFLIHSPLSGYFHFIQNSSFISSIMRTTASNIIKHVSTCTRTSVSLVLISRGGTDMP